MVSAHNHNRSEPAAGRRGDEFDDRRTDARMLEIERQVEVRPTVLEQGAQRWHVLGQILRRTCGDRAAPPPDADDAVVVEHEHAVGRQPDVALETGGPELQGNAKRLDRVFRGAVAGAPMGEADRRIEQRRQPLLHDRYGRGAVAPNGASTPEGGPMELRRTHHGHPRLRSLVVAGAAGVVTLSVVGSAQSAGATSETTVPGDETTTTGADSTTTEAATPTTDEPATTAAAAHDNRRRGHDDRAGDGVVGRVRRHAWKRSARVTRATSCWHRVCRS